MKPSESPAEPKYREPVTFLADLILRWRRQPDHYNWLSDYLEAQELRGFTRLMMTVVVLSFGIVPVLMRFSPEGPPAGPRRTVGLLISAVCLGLAALWATRWPTRRQSKVFAIVSALSIGLCCVINSSPGAGMLGCAAFAALAGYVAVSHTSGYLVFVIALTIGGAVFNAIRIVHAGDPAGALSNGMVVVIGVLAVPLFVQVLMYRLGNDAAESDLDALTGLRNRRAFFRGAQQLVRAQGSARVGALMVDIDSFKQVNDTRGHSAGDRLLIAVSDILRRVAGDECVVARFGGEEFTVAAVLDNAALQNLAARIRDEVRALPDGVTVSVGVASAAVADPTALRHLMDQLVDAADAAMYGAKRAGGDRVGLAASG